MEMSRILDFKPTPCRARQSIINNPARLIIACAGRSGGKWIYCGAEFVNRTLDTHPICQYPIYAYCYPTINQARRNVWEKLVRMYRNAGAVQKVNETEMKIKLTNGATVYCMGLESSERLEGNHYCGIAVDEMSDTKPSAITQSVIPALNAYKGWLFLLGIPKRNGIGGPYYRKLCEMAQSGKKAIGGFTTSYHHWTSTEIYTPKEIEAYEDLMDPKTFNEHFLATWENAVGQVYYGFDEVESVFRDERYREDSPLLIGSDFNVNPMSWVVCQGDTEHLDVIDELSIKNTNTQETLDILYSRYGNHPGGFVFYGDAAGRQRHTSAAVSDYIQIFNDKRFANPKTGNVDIRYLNQNPVIMDRVASVNTLLKAKSGKRRLFVSEKCVELIKDFISIVYKEGDRDLDKADPMRTHMSDALGYLVHKQYPVRPEIIKKPGKIITLGAF